METRKLDFDIDDLSLDLDNPRTGEVTSQSDALAAIVRLSMRNFRNMMHSIKEHGLDPGDSFYLVESEDESEFTVVDGNRRLAALKVLQNPELLQGTDLPETSKKPLIRKAEGYVAPRDSAVSCVLFESRAEAGEWIERRHGRGLEGEGRIAWGSLEIQRFQKDQTVLDVITFVERNSEFSDEDWARIKSSVEKNTSTLRRFLESKAGREHLSFIVNGQNGGPDFRFDASFMIDVLSQIFSDIDSGDVNTRTHNKASEIEDYFSSLPPELNSSGQKPKEAKDFATSVVRDRKARPRQVAKAARIVKAKAKKVSAPRRTMAPNKHSFVEPDNEKGKQLFREASRLRLKDTPLACAYLFRAIIEHTVDTEMRKSRLPREEDGCALDLQTRFERVVSHINNSGRVSKGDLSAIKTTLTAKNGPVSIGALNGFIHNRFQMPSADELRNAWDHAIPLFTAIYGTHR